MVSICLFSAGPSRTCRVTPRTKEIVLSAHDETSKGVGPVGITFFFGVLAGRELVDASAALLGGAGDGAGMGLGSAFGGGAGRAAGIGVEDVDWAGVAGIEEGDGDPC